MADRHFLQQLTKRLADEGKLIEAGWVALRLEVIADNAPPMQLTEMRLAYMAGAQHLFSSIMNVLDSGTEWTDADLTRMNSIEKELEVFRAELDLWVGRTRGTA